MMKDVDIDDDAFKHIEAIIHSMTPKERAILQQLMQVEKNESVKALVHLYNKLISCLSSLIK